MPVRIYEISKKHGLENRDVLAMAKELGVTAAKVPSSSLDKVTAEYIENHLYAKYPKAKIEEIPRNPPNPTVEEAIQAPIEQSSKPTLFPAKDDQFLGIKLENDTSVEIYSCIESGFQHVGTFAFQIASKPLRESIQQDEIILITNNENATLEFKASARWDYYQNRFNQDLQNGICKTVAAFMNTEGGTLLIGVADNAKVIGLKQDLATFQKAKNDDYLLFLHSILLDNLGPDLRSCINISIMRLRDKDICRITIRRAPRAVFIKKDNDESFYIRAGNSSKKLSLKTALEYIKARE